MPSRDTVLTGLTAIANDWLWLAIAWHALLGALFVRLLTGRRPSIRSVGFLLVALLLSVGLMAWMSGNPFNGIVFTVLSATLGKTAAHLSDSKSELARHWWIAAGSAFILFGWTYPHFVRATVWTTYFYASPLGLLPCPTLSVVLGLTLLFPGLRTKLWGTTLVGAGLLYGTIGVFMLGVSLDWGLLFASTTLAAVLTRDLRGAAVNA